MRATIASGDFAVGLILLTATVVTVSSSFFMPTASAFKTRPKQPDPISCPFDRIDNYIIFLQNVVKYRRRINRV